MVSSCAAAWREIGAPAVVMSWIRYGYRLPFVKRVLPFRQSEWVPTSDIETESARNMIRELLSLGAVSVVSHSQYVSRARLEPKRTGGFRLIVDLRHINTHLQQRSCKYETLQVLEQLAQAGDWMFSFDLKNGYYHVPIHESYRKFLTFSFEGRLYQFNVLPFGLSTAPLVFTKLMRPVVSFWRSKGLRLLPYLDDFLFLSSTIQEAGANRNLVENTLNCLGLQRNVAKGQWDPVTSLVHLGVGIDTTSTTFFVPEDKLLILKASARSILSYACSHRRWVQGPKLQSFLGFAQSLRVAVPLTNTNLRSMYDCMAQQQGTSRDFKLSNQALRDLRWYVDIPPTETRFRIVPPQASRTVATDASGFGWGAVLDGSLTSRGFWDQTQMLEHINVKELSAVCNALKYFHRPLRGTPAIHVFTDNMVVRACLLRGSSRSARLMHLIRDIKSELARLGAELQPEWIPSAANTLPDQLSRATDPHDWTVASEFFQYVTSTLGSPTVDRFATAANARLPRYNSRVFDPGSLGNAFITPWSGEYNWINPPWLLIPRIWQKLVKDKANAILLLPYWRSAPWFHYVLRYATRLLVFPPPQVHRFVQCTNPATPEPLANHRWSLCLVQVLW